MNHKDFSTIDDYIKGSDDYISMRFKAVAKQSKTEGERLLEYFVKYCIDIPRLIENIENEKGFKFERKTTKSI